MLLLNQKSYSFLYHVQAFSSSINTYLTPSQQHLTVDLRLTYRSESLTNLSVLWFLKTPSLAMLLSKPSILGEYTRSSECPLDMALNVRSSPKACQHVQGSLLQFLLFRSMMSESLTALWLSFPRLRGSKISYQ